MPEENTSDNKTSDNNFIPVDDNGEEEKETPKDEVEEIKQVEPSNKKKEPMSMAEKIRQARLSMEGPERTIKRERSEKEKKINEEKKVLAEEMALIAKRKEDLEIAWVVMDNKRVDLKKLLAPILAEEEKLETTEEELEGKERTTIDPTERQKIEKERWAIQDKRREIEKQKWNYEDKIMNIEETIDENTEKYQELLDEEEKKRRRLDELEADLQMMEEQEILEKEEARRKLELQQMEAERKRREELKRKEEEEEAKRREEERKKKEAELAKKKTEDETKKIGEEAKKREEEKKLAENSRLKTEAEKASEVAAQALAKAKKRDEELARIKSRGEMELKRQEVAREEKPPTITTPKVEPSKPAEKIEVEFSQPKKPAVEQKPLERPVPPTPPPPQAPTPAKEDLIKQDPEIKSLVDGEETSLPKLRTLKTDMERARGVK